MSQSIYAHVEYKIEHEHALFSLFSKLYLERDYIFMALLGGGPSQSEIQAIFPLRGMPADRNPLTFSAFYMMVSDKETDKERWTSRRQAEKWVEDGDARWVGVGKNCITDPDYFGPSWLLTEELEQVYREYQKHDTSEFTSKSLSVVPVLGAMRLLPEARLVYWFGN